MPSIKTKLWEAKPHTIAKIKLLREYLYLWFRILGTRCPGKDLLYVDGFSGPGEYTNYGKGSPIAAIEAYQAAKQDVGTEWRAGQVRFGFIDHDKRRITHLQQKLSQHPSSRTYLEVMYHACPFENGIAKIREQIPAAFNTDAPLFVFIDPFGTGAPFQDVSRLLSSERSEVLINLDADGLTRIAAAGKAANSDAVLADVFGMSDWAEHLDLTKAREDQCRQVLHIYKQQLFQHADYVFSFEMRDQHNLVSYYLVFASNHPLGLKKMKEAMGTIDKTGEYKFRDADEGQSRLFQFDRPDEWTEWAEKMFAICKGKRLEWDQLQRYVLNETPFINVSPLLKPMDDKGYLAKIEVVPGAQRNKGQFTKEKVVAVQFVDQRMVQQGFWN
ncbi:MAG: three-Cys-motif partner protein TcmP [Pirellulales bacterium]